MAYAAREWTCTYIGRDSLWILRTQSRDRPLVPAMIFTWWIPQAAFLATIAGDNSARADGLVPGHRVEPIARLHSWTASTWRPSLGMGVKDNYGRDRSNSILASRLFAGPACPGFNTVQPPYCLVLHGQELKTESRSSMPVHDGRYRD